MKSFYSYITEARAKVEKSKDEQAKVNAKGVLHELLVGKHLNNGEHMPKHENSDGMSPAAAHDHFKKLFSDDEYNVIHNRAKSAAEHIKKHLKGDGIKEVHWTSKPGDLERTTGIPATQKQDASDLVVTTHDKTHPSGVRHHGISLKVSDKTDKVSLSNLGKNALFGAEKILETHRNKIKQDYPELATKEASNKPKRKQIVNSNPAMKSDIRNRNNEVLKSMAKHIHGQLKSMSKEKLADHAKELLHAHSTPMQDQGHVHFRHNTWGTTNIQHSVTIPDEKHSHIFKSDLNDLDVQHRSQSIVFTHKGKPFLRQSVKFTSQSDPMSAAASNAAEMGSKEKAPKKEKAKK